jgi:riboflavin synthase
MFTGIVQATGRIAARDGAADGVRVRIDAAALGVADIAVGDSIAVGGCCLTVVAIDAHVLAFDVSAETLACTAGFDVGREVNLEKSLRLSDRLGGHLVSGHVDGVGVVAAFAPVSTGAQGSWYLSIDAPVALALYIASKGSIAVDGVSLTVNGVEGARFTVNLIPHTLAATTLRQLAVGRPVNLEVDVIARYVERLRSVPSPLLTKE